MKTLAYILFSILVALAMLDFALASPILRWYVPQITTCSLVGPSDFTLPSPSVQAAEGVCDFDLATLPRGTPFNAHVSAFYSMNGPSPAGSFAFTIPPIPEAPTNPRIAP